VGNKLIKVAAIFGDCHGKANLLRKLVSKIREKYPSAEIFSVGDLIDRGPSSKEVIQICIDEGIEGIIGNHDQWLQHLARDMVFDPFCIKPIMGGQATLLSYGVDMLSDGENYFPKGRPPAELAIELYNSMPKEHIEWISSLPPYRKIEVAGEVYWLIHAGLNEPTAASWNMKSMKNPEDKFSDEEMMERISKGALDSILWARPMLGYKGRSDSLYRFDNATQVFGHSPVKKPITKEHFIALDTGCGTCEPFTLTAIVLPSKEIIQVKEEMLWAEKSGL